MTLALKKNMQEISKEELTNMVKDLAVLEIMLSEIDRDMFNIALGEYYSDEDMSLPEGVDDDTQKVRKIWDKWDEIIEFVKARTGKRLEIEILNEEDKLYAFYLI